MPLHFTSRLQALFSEIRNRFFYLLLSLFFTFVISYCYSKPLLYLFTLPFVNRYFKNDFLVTEGCAFGTTFGVATQSKMFFYQGQKANTKNNFTIDLNTIHENGQGYEEKTNLILHKDFLLGKTEIVFDQLNGSSISFFSGPQLENLLDFCKQFTNVASRSFIFTDVEEAFSCQILICFILSFAMVFPIVVYESFSFFAPSLYKTERRKWIWRLSTIGVIWCFFIYNVQNYCLPKLADFLLRFEISSLAFSLTAETKIKSYCIWAITIFIIGNLVFFFTVCILFLIYEQKIEIKYFTVRRKISRICILLFSAFLAPPEIQLFLALAGIFCFELMVYFFFIYKQFQIPRCVSKR